MSVWHNDIRIQKRDVAIDELIALVNIWMEQFPDISVSKDSYYYHLKQHTNKKINKIREDIK